MAAAEALEVLHPFSWNRLAGPRHSNAACNREKKDASVMLFLRPATCVLRFQQLRTFSSVLQAASFFPSHSVCRSPFVELPTCVQGASPSSAGFASRASSSFTQPKMACAEVIPIPTLSDNYAYLVIDKKTKAAACVDPAEPEKVVAAAKQHGVTLQTCLCTHRHSDHSGGNVKIKSLLPNIEVVCSAYEETPGRTKARKLHVSTGDLLVKVLHAPCHTAGHVLYYMESRTDMNEKPIIFTGDTLFLAGCGRFFEGDAAQMHKALKKIAALPSETLVYCGHEYSVANLQFAATVEPNNAILSSKLDWAKKQRAAGKPTIPSSIGEEKGYNPFMRVDKPEVQKAAGAPQGDEVQTLHILRERKNVFRG
ncbi:hypothetical protein Efla_003210 [Eimeria flavescens]